VSEVLWAYEGRNAPPGIFVISTVGDGVGTVGWLRRVAMPLRAFLLFLQIKNTYLEFSQLFTSQCPSGHFCYFYETSPMFSRQRSCWRRNAPPGIFVISTFIIRELLRVTKPGRISRNAPPGIFVISTRHRRKRTAQIVRTVAMPLRAFLLFLPTMARRTMARTTPSRNAPPGIFVISTRPLLAAPFNPLNGYTRRNASPGIFVISTCPSTTGTPIACASGRNAPPGIFVISTGLGIDFLPVSNDRVAMPLRAFLLFLPNERIGMENCDFNYVAMPLRAFLLFLQALGRFHSPYRVEKSQCPSGHFCYFYRAEAAEARAAQLSQCPSGHFCYFYLRRAAQC
jgi:hypothetical protein